MKVAASNWSPEMVQMAEPWVSVEDVAAHLGVRKESVYRWIEHRGLPATKIGKLWKLKFSEIDAWMRARRDVDVKASPAAASRTTESAGGLRRDGSPARVVLVIDDDELVRETLADFLGDEGFGVLLASDGAEALKLLASASRRPSLIILDLKMPNLDGWHFREEQSSDPNLASIPVIVVTGARDASLNAAAVLRKPLRLTQLANTIDSLLEKGTKAPDEPAAENDARRPSAGAEAMNLETRDCPIATEVLDVVVVDDSEDNAEMLAELLGSYGHRVRVANLGHDALDLLAEDLPDVVFLDVGLPDMDGYEVAASIRARFGETVRLVALTGFSGAETRARARAAGFDAFITKPGSTDDIRNALRSEPLMNQQRFTPRAMSVALSRAGH